MVQKRCARADGQAWLESEWKIYVAGRINPADADIDAPRTETNTAGETELPDESEDEWTQAPASSRGRGAKVTRALSHQAHDTRSRLLI
jgi:hypothetical protein